MKLLKYFIRDLITFEDLKNKPDIYGNRGTLTLCSNLNNEIKEHSIYIELPINTNSEVELDDLSICFESLFSVDKKQEKVDNNYYKIYKKSTYTKLTAYNHLKYGAEELSVYIGFPINSEFNSIYT